MGLNSSAIQVAAEAIAADITLLSLHTGDPGANGTANPTTAGVEPVVCTAVGGNVTCGPVAFQGGTPKGPVTHVGLHSGPSYRGSIALDPTGDTAFNAAGEYTISTLSILGTSD